MGFKSISSQDSAGPTGVTGPASVNTAQMAIFSDTTGKVVSGYTGTGVVFNNGASGVAAITVSANIVAGSSSIVGTTDTQTVSAKTFSNCSLVPRVQSLTDAATITPNADNTDLGLVTTLSQNSTIANPTGSPVDGQRLVVRIKSTSIRTLAFGAQFRGGVTLALPSATTGSAKTDYLIFIWNAADSKWDIFQSLLGF